MPRHASMMHSQRRQPAHLPTPLPQSSWSSSFKTRVSQGLKPEVWLAEQSSEAKRGIRRDEMWFAEEERCARTAAGSVLYPDRLRNVARRRAHRPKQTAGESVRIARAEGEERQVHLRRSELPWSQTNA
jgi:hypothetical protein